MIKKDIDTATEKKILKLKGSLIAQSFTDIIHFDDDGEYNYINFFTVTVSRKDDVIAHIRQGIADLGLEEAIAIAVPVNK
jgi:hypothetical protein